MREEELVVRIGEVERGLEEVKEGVGVNRIGKDEKLVERGLGKG